MKSLLPLALGAVLSVSGLPAAESKFDLQDKKTRVSYAIGVDIGSTFKRQELDLDAVALAAGLADAYYGTGKTQLTEQEVESTLQAFRVEMMTRARDRQAAEATENLKKGEAFLAENKKKSGVKTLASGLQYEVIKTGKGKSPKATDTVRAHYHGTLIDGTVFDSSVQRGEPLEIPVSGVIPGWTEALQLMKEGDKWRLFIPAALAYGPEGRPPVIAPNSTLIFEVELLGIEK